MALSRRQFVQTATIAGGAALTANVWGRGRENSIWSAFEPELQAVEKGMICIGSNENPVGPGPKVLGTLKWGVVCETMLHAWLTGNERDIEKAVIGRRASEAEIDLLTLLAPR